MMSRKEVHVDGPATREEFVEAFGMTMAAQGMPRAAGRILGALLVAVPPERSAEELADTLQASRGSISTMTRLLESVGLVERVSRSGDRRHYYRMRRGGLAEATAQRVRGMRAMADLARRGQTLLADAPAESRLALEELEEFYDFWADETLRLAEAYLELVRARRGDAPSLASHDAARSGAER
jgi:DNA-binding MarR family transcriptional regulator